MSFYNWEHDPELGTPIQAPHGPEGPEVLVTLPHEDRLLLAKSQLFLTFENRGHNMTDSDVLAIAETWTISLTDENGCYIENDIGDYELLRNRLFLFLDGTN